MTTPDARPVSEARLAELIDEYDQFNLLRPDSGFGRDTLAALRELQSLRAEVDTLRSALGNIDTALGVHLLVTEDGELEAAVRNTKRSIIALVARIASLEKDAGRYRWLRDTDAIVERTVVMPLKHGVDVHDVELKCGESLDAAIDAAMEERA